MISDHSCSEYILDEAIENASIERIDDISLGRYKSVLEQSSIYIYTESIMISPCKAWLLIISYPQIPSKVRNCCPLTIIVNTILSFMLKEKTLLFFFWGYFLSSTFFLWLSTEIGSSKFFRLDDLKVLAWLYCKVCPLLFKHNFDASGCHK